MPSISLHSTDIAKFRFITLESNELNEMALQPNCALWKLHIAGEPPGPFLLLMYEVRVQRQEDGMEQCSRTGALRGAWGAAVPLWVCLGILSVTPAVTIKGKRY